MKNNKLWPVFAVLFVIVFSLASLTGCKKEEVIRIWVGSEAREFYQEKMDQWVERYNAANSTPFGYTVVVEAVDAGSAAAKFLDDTDAGADILTIAHDNLGRLIAGASAIGPITDERLLAQIYNDNPDIFFEIVRGTVAGQEYTFGVPYRSQALVLYYNRDYISDEDVKTWEAIWQVARASGKQSVTINGDDGFNNSFLVLATRESDGMPIADIYLHGDFANCNFNSDLAVATMQWGQRFFTDTSADGRSFHGARIASDSGWEVELRNEASLSLIGGSWNFNAARAALGSKLGIAPLPSFTLTAADVAGTSIAPGTVMHSGTFADAIMFVMKKYTQNTERAVFVQQILMYLSSKEVQEEAFNAFANQPAYKNAATEFASIRANTVEGLLSRTQNEMFANGRPQPFGPNARMNNWYYSQGAPAIVLDILTDRTLYGTTAEIREGMFVVETIWKTGRRPE